MTGETKSGFKFEINEKIFNDWDFITLSDDIKGGKASMRDINTLFIMVLGSKGFKDLKDHVSKNHDGIVDVTAMKDEFAEIVESTKVKNSPSSPSV